MAKGRKAKKANLHLVREPNGRHSRSSQDSAHLSPPSAVKRLRDAAVAGMMDPRWATELGRLFLKGYIAEDQFAAGERWVKLSSDYSKALDMPPSFPAKANFISMPQGRALLDDETVSKRDQHIMQEMHEAHAILISSGHERIVRVVCEASTAVGGEVELESLRVGLSWLADHWGLTKHRRNVRN